MLLQVENLEVKYGNIQALHGISFHVNEGEIVTLIGANGAGKTTCLYSITRLPPPEAPRVVGGEIRFKGESILKNRPSDVVRKLHLALSPEGRRIFGNLSVMENLKLATYSREKDADLEAEYERIFDLFPRLKERRTQRSESLSGGEQQRIAIARALIHNPDIILADEPTGNLDYETGLQIIHLLDRVVKKKGKTMIMVTHSKDVIGLADKIFSLKEGKLIEMKNF